MIKLRIFRQRDYLDYPSEPNAITRALASETGRQQSETERELAALGDGLEDEDGARAQKLRSRRASWQVAAPLTPYQPGGASAEPSRVARVALSL